LQHHRRFAEAALSFEAGRLFKRRLVCETEYTGEAQEQQGCRAN
jgi:hypothetical protein